jgi:hypothetical protein
MDTTNRCPRNLKAGDPARTGCPGTRFLWTLAMNRRTVSALDRRGDNVWSTGETAMPHRSRMTARHCCLNNRAMILPKCRQVRRRDGTGLCLCRRLLPRREVGTKSEYRRTRRRLKVSCKCNKAKEMDGERGRSRTYNLLIKSLFSADITACYCLLLAG